MLPPASKLVDMTSEVEVGPVDLGCECERQTKTFQESLHPVEPKGDIQHANVTRSHYGIGASVDERHETSNAFATESLAHTPDTTLNEDEQLAPALGSIQCLVYSK